MISFVIERLMLILPLDCMLNLSDKQVTEASAQQLPHFP
jgi:hypothetical protein